MTKKKSFDLLMIILEFLFVCGLFIDGWAHNHLPSTLETFFTPWHALFYGAFFALALTLFWQAFKARRKGISLMKGLPFEYQLSFAGVIIFLAAGFGDLLWHTIFGIEANIEALLSPTHLLLALSGAMIVSAQFRKLWSDDELPSSFFQALPALISLTLILSFITFMTQYVHPFAHPWMGARLNDVAQANTASIRQALGLGEMFIQAAILTGFMLLAIRRWRMPAGSFTLVLTLNAIGMTLMHDEYRFIITALVSGVILDIVWMNIQARLDRARMFRLLGFLIPFILYACYVFTILATEGTWWSVHLSAGVPFMVGIEGYLLTFLALPPGESHPY